MTQIRRHILVVGSVGADIVVEVNRMPARGETLSASKPDTGNVYPGGKGDNQAATIAKLIGPDHPTLIAKMACHGANSAWPEELPTALIDAIKNAAIVLVQCEIPVRRNVLPLLTFVCPNETELARLTTRGVNNVEDAIEASRFLQDQGAKDVLVTLGSDGSVFVPADGSKVLRQSAFKVDNVVDTTGAGDCYRGAFVVAFAEGRALQDCMLRASAASALCVQHAGALPSLPLTDEVVAFLKVNGLE
ncbi:ribokinase, putative [Phytophthora infestans T30-4]|uniref:Ribokinase, putative n=1 Tax=Phytophthora infestans (strain T30-4) TaxID=403677 RepID=D0MYV7_PHYIT|nr:ribokinase, putative [Phytophthora infestans T30-4]EEY66355.1 ribokinase, putative [Phytophthora infestans T30-4]|eukprot:XP_002906954.1 ribokinase, putative [Phytophthora infestans T30-4]